MTTRLLPLCLALVLAGCSSVSLDQTSGTAGTAPIQSREAQITGDQATAIPASQSAASGVSADRAISPETLRLAGYNAKGEASVYFEFNQPNIKPEYQPLLAYTADMLKANPKGFLRVEGHADERGTVEYNLALGQRRSEAVREAMMLLGISDDQIEVMSYGEERPRAKGQTEADHAENRRADLFLKASR